MALCSILLPQRHREANKATLVLMEFDHMGIDRACDTHTKHQVSESNHMKYYHLYFSFMNHTPPTLHSKGVYVSM